MAEKNKILVRSAATIRPTLIEYADFESSKAKDNDRQLFRGNLSGFKQREGLMEPVVQIGAVRLAKHSVKALKIWQEGLLPTISITIIDNGYVFTSRGYPLSNIIVSVFIQSPLKKLKSMAADFLITSISSMPIPNSTSIVYTLSGELNVPFLYGNYSKSYANLTSLQVMQKVAGELQLGFADNQAEGTNDTMTWIMPNYTYKSFLNHVSKFAYRDDSNFFDCFIDRYYILNFVNVEKQFSRDEEIDTCWQALDQSVIDKRRQDPEQNVEEEVEVPMILTNYPEANQTEFFIKDFSIDSNHGEIVKKNAVRKYVYWYEHGANGDSSKQDDANYRIHFAEPLTSTVSNDGMAPQTVQIPEYTNSVEKPDDGPKISTNVWSGIDYNNAHASYKFAELLNHHNWLETEKNILNVTLPGFSVNLMRGSRVRVNLYMSKASAMMANTMADDGTNDPMLNTIKTGIPALDSKPQSMILDKALSDFYYVRSVNYSYYDGKFQTEVTLSRRHWMIPTAKNTVKV
jgi:hypothetical protein